VKTTRYDKRNKKIRISKQKRRRNKNRDLIDVFHRRIRSSSNGLVPRFGVNIID
jgi:hypothetical protein